MSTRPRFLATAAVALASAAALAGCASDTASSEASLTVEDPWVKTVESGMTAAFATLTNTTDADLTVVAASSDAAPMIELHEVVDGDMQEKDGGFTVPAGETLTLQPGGYHLMLMGVEEPIVAGDEVAFTLELEDGSTVGFTATAKDFDGANEDYDGESMDAESSH
ncbi:copper chaperone PCu(A)C [Demequina rhizosphaerae]|uniref:copper chaperone PCu(A)C n=1 Tax=Demequina rhizosphaerae TaxID=1638985 RepID=UPI000783BA41|nr:copper chaperone PCu(A)C [Demequina rhizosphaerae]